MTTFRHKLSMFSLGMLLPLFALFPANADDTEVFFGGGTSKPNVLFILDSSGSMRGSRIQQVKEAIGTLISSAKHMNVAVMQFNSSRGGSVISPFTDLDSTIAVSSRDTVASTISEVLDAASENVKGDDKGKVEKYNDILVSLDETNLVGLRFNNIDIPKDHEIVSANIILEGQLFSFYPHILPASITITGEKTPNPAQFTLTDNNISSRPSTSSSVSWNISTAWIFHGLYPSTDIKDIISELTSDPNWVSGNSMVFKLQTTVGRTYTSTVPVEFNDTLGSRLIIKTAPIIVPAHKPSIDIINTVNKIFATGNTPLINALYEGVLYLTGAAVNTGLTRADNYSRVSHPGSYEGGTVVRSDDCKEYFYNDSNCASETIQGNAVYQSPITETCQSDNNYIILLTDGMPSGLHNRTTEIEALTGSVCEEKDRFQCGTNLAKFIADGDLAKNLNYSKPSRGKLFTIGFNFDDTNLKALATAGNGLYRTANNAAGLSTAFNEIFETILEVDTTFTSTGLSVNTFNKLSHRNELYFSLFKPTETVQWQGNLKRYKLNGSGQIIDATTEDAAGAAISGQPAMDDATGTFKSTAKSFWSDSIDGDIVSLGGAASKLLGGAAGSEGARKVFSNLSGSDLSADINRIDATNANLQAVGTFGLSNTDGSVRQATDSERIDLVNFIRGVDSDRNSLGRMLDPLHSTPFVVSYGADEATGETLVFFGDNQGLLHAIDTKTGIEKWAFMPKELLKLQSTLKSNNEYADTGHIYGLDGDITGATINGKKYLYVGMRRGGRSYYGFNITDKDKPTLAWKITGGSGDFKELGQSWSKPIKTKITIGNNTKEVLIFAGGYDEAQDSKNTRSADSMGRAIYIVDAQTGARLWWASGTGIKDGSNKSATEQLTDMNYSFASNIKVIDTNNDSVADQMYVGDTGGQLWRFDIDNGKSVNSLIDGIVIADINGGTEATNRRFYHAPDVSTFDHDTLAIALGSGFQAHPLNTTIEDNFYLIKTPTQAPSTYDNLQHNPLNLMNVTSSDDNGEITAVDLEILATKNGWYLELKGNSGEKVLASSRTANEEIWFSTFEPKPQTSICTATPGLSRLYRVNYIDGSPIYKTTIPEQKGQSCGDSGIKCLMADRALDLKTPSLPTEPVILRINGKKMIAVGKEVRQFGTIEASTMYWTDNQ